MFNRFSENLPLLLLLAQNKRLSSAFIQIMCIIKFWPGMGEMQRWNAKVFVRRDRISFAIISFKQSFSFNILIIRHGSCIIGGETKHFGVCLRVLVYG